jgi:hypothetical protein
VEGDAFIIDQPYTWFVNRYRVHEPADAGYTPGALLAFCEQKRFALREDLRIHRDEAKSGAVMRIHARRVIDIGGRYDVTDDSGAPLERRARRSLLRTTWALLDASGAELAVMRERSIPVAIFRRVRNLLEFIPLFGLMIALVLDLIPVSYHFDLLRDGEVIGGHTRRIGIRDRYRLEITGDPEHRIDRRLLIAMGIALDALQSR